MPTAVESAPLCENPPASCWADPPLTVLPDGAVIGGCGISGPAPADDQRPADTAAALQPRPD